MTLQEVQAARKYRMASAMINRALDEVLDAWSLSNGSEFCGDNLDALKRLHRHVSYMVENAEKTF